MKNYVDGGEAVVQAFRSLDVDYVMASPGSEWGPVWEAFARQQVSNTKGPTYLSCAHETLAVDLAIGYTLMTGKMQAVMLHTGVGLLQGSMGIDSAQRMGIPMVVVSGESLSYGDRDDGFDPGPQWQASLSVVGGPYRLVEPLVKWAQQASSPATLYQQLVNAGEMAQRTPVGPTYMTVPIETMRADWTPPNDYDIVKPAPKPHAALTDIEDVAARLVKAKNPCIIVEALGRDPDGYDALIELAETLALPVVEGAWADYTNFPKDHELHQGVGQSALVAESDVLLTIRTKAPWYPAKNRPAKAHIVAIDETPFRHYMVYHNVKADQYLEGDAVQTIELLTKAVKDAGIDQGAVDARRKALAASHDKLMKANAELRQKEAAKAGPMQPVTAVRALSDSLPADTIYVDETITHRGLLLRHLENKGPQTYLRVNGGLGQGLGVALGVKLAVKERPVTLVIGDGSFMYNPVIQSLALGKHADMPILIVIMNNHGYDAMRKEHHAYYPDGVAAENQIYYGHPVTEFKYHDLPTLFGGYGKLVEDPADLPAALKEGLEATKQGKLAIVNVVVDS